MGRKPGVDSRDTRAAIVRASLDLFSRQDFSETTLEEIANVVGITKGAIYWHFPTKDALFDGVLQDIGRRWREAVLNPTFTLNGPKEQIGGLFDHYYDFLGANPAVCLLLARGLLSPDGERARAVRTVFRQTREVIVDVIESGQGTGAIDPDVDAPAVAQTILAILLGTQILVTKGGRPSRKSVFDEANRMMQRLFR